MNGFLLLKSKRNGNILIFNNFIYNKIKIEDVKIEFI